MGDSFKVESVESIPAMPPIPEHLVPLQILAAKVLLHLTSSDRPVRVELSLEYPMRSVCAAITRMGEACNSRVFVSERGGGVVYVALKRNVEIKDGAKNAAFRMNPNQGAGA